METIEEETKELEQKKKSSLIAFDPLNDVADAAFPNIWVLLHLTIPVRNSLWMWILKNEIDYDRSIDQAISHDRLPSKPFNWWSRP